MLLHQVLSHAVLSHAVLLHQVLSHAVLLHQVISHAVLSYAVLLHQELSHAVLLHQVLSPAVLLHQVLSNEMLSHAVAINSTTEFVVKAVQCAVDFHVGPGGPWESRLKSLVLGGLEECSFIKSFKPIEIKSLFRWFFVKRKANGNIKNENGIPIPIDVAY